MALAQVSKHAPSHGWLYQGWLFDLVTGLTFLLMLLASLGLFCFFYPPTRARRRPTRPLAAAVASWRALLSEWDLDDDVADKVEEIAGKLARADEAGSIHAGSIQRGVLHPSLHRSLHGSHRGARLAGAERGGDLESRQGLHGPMGRQAGGLQAGQLSHCLDANAVPSSGSSSTRDGASVCSRHMRMSGAYWYGGQ